LVLFCSIITNSKVENGTTSRYQTLYPLIRSEIVS